MHLKRVMRKHASVGEKTFVLTADVAEAHRQSQIEAGGDVYIINVGRLRLVLLVAQPQQSADCRSTSLEDAPIRGINWWPTTSPGSRRDRVQSSSGLILRALLNRRSERRAAWFVRCTEEIARAHTVNTASFEEGLGRVMYVAGALEHERPFLSPLDSFLSLHPRGAVRIVPTYVK